MGVIVASPSNSAFTRASMVGPTGGDDRPSFVYGDSTPFPYGGNFIETVRHAIDCGVALMNAQHTLVRSGARAHEVEHARQIERTRLEALATTVKRAMGGETSGATDRVQRTGARIVEAARMAVDAELVALETRVAEELAKTRAAKTDARAAALRAIETFLLHHDLPGTNVGLRMIAQENGYASQALVETPFGVEAVFDLAIPPAHEWGGHRRVGDLASGVLVHLPLPSGLFFKRVEVQPLKLDRFYLSTLHLAMNRSVITVRRGGQWGSGYKLTLDAHQGSMRVSVCKLDDEGVETPDPSIDLTGDDAMHVLRLWQRILDSTTDLPIRRNTMASATVDMRRIQELDEPQLVCERIVRVLAPIVREIGKRSGAPGELVLRRDVKAGRRDEVYITKAELQEKVLTLPPALRAVFDPFELESPRSPRAPAPSLPAYVEAEEADEDSTPFVAPKMALLTA